jgi:hypothetical protein
MNILLCGEQQFTNHRKETSMERNLKLALGLRDGQRHSDHVSGTRGAGWYNERGQWLGWGDLRNPDLEAIATELTYGERFIILHEEDSYRRFIRNIVPGLSRAFRNEDAPGLDYVAEHAILIIETRAIYSISLVLSARTEWRNGITYQVIDKCVAEENILGATLDEWRSSAKAFHGGHLQAQC